MTEVARLEETIAIKNARILELEESLREALGPDADMDIDPSPSPSPSPDARGWLRWKAEFDSVDDVLRCPKCDWELDEESCHCERCDSWSGELYDPEEEEDANDDDEDEDEDYEPPTES
jgi:hypothetical protein